MSTPIDPVNLEPVSPLRNSYVFHSALPAAERTSGEGWIMGIDEAGRGRESNTCLQYGVYKANKASASCTWYDNWINFLPPLADTA